jgi:SAM-dependent methyltransferase
LKNVNWIEKLYIKLECQYALAGTAMKPLYPITYKLNRLDRLFTFFPVNRIPFLCNVCGKFSLTSITRKEIPYPETQLRESIICTKCGATNRNRQIASIICQSPNSRIKHSSLLDFARNENLSVYNTEAARAIHNTLKLMGNTYICSEYLGDQYKSGEMVNDIMHQELMKTSFPDESFDLVITSDVLEHVSDPWKAFKEINRILKPKGRHVFTIPFYQDRASTERRAYINDQAQIVHVKEPFYHIDPLRSEGAFVYTIFSIDVLAKLEDLGFRTDLYKLYNPLRGILAQNAIVFESVKLGK